MARRNSRVIFNGWPSWRYGPDGQGAIFQSEAEVPWGWTVKPGKPELSRQEYTVAILDRTKLIDELTVMGIDIKPTWGTAHMKRIIDGDISSTW